MATEEKDVAWVVYRMTLHGKPQGVNAVCEQSEWEAMEQSQPAITHSSRPASRTKAKRRDWHAACLGAPRPARSGSRPANRCGRDARHLPRPLYVL
jgi:hypothetical protein